MMIAIPTPIRTSSCDEEFDPQDAGLSQYLRETFKFEKLAELNPRAPSHARNHEAWQRRTHAAWA
jgi:hypothetical protein